MLSIVLIVLGLVVLCTFMWYFSRGTEWMMTEEELAEAKKTADVSEEEVKKPFNWKFSG